jgi:hypothetical protein
MQVKDFLSKYGPPLHMGTINQADFRYPGDFHAFEQPATSFVDITDNIVYELRGPVEVSPVGNLVGPITGAPEAFQTLVINSGIYRSKSARCLSDN